MQAWKNGCKNDDDDDDDEERVSHPAVAATTATL